LAPISSLLEWGGKKAKREKGRKGEKKGFPPHKNLLMRKKGIRRRRLES